MGLQIWLPLDGSLINYGLDKTQPQYIGGLTGNSTSSGKVTPQVYQWSTNGNAVNLPDFMNTFKNYKQYTIAAWVYYTGAAENHSSTICSSGNWNNYSLVFGLNNYNSGYNKILVPSARSGGWSDGATISTLALNTWHHIAVTYNGTLSRIYINGQEAGTFNGGGITSSSETSNLYIGAATYYAGFTIRGKINDFRIYDHCCSAREISDVAKGLVVHYPLNNNGIGAPNLLGSMVECNKNFTLIDNYTLDGVMGNGDTYCRFSFPTALTSGDTYTLSFDVSGLNEGTTWTFSLANNAKYKYTINKNGHHKYTFIPLTSDAGMENLAKFLWDDQGQTNAQSTPVRISNIKIEAGSEDSHWQPHSSNAKYIEYNVEPTIEYDCSGYAHNAIKTGSLTYQGDTPRYDCSTIFDGSSTWIDAPIKALMTNLLADKFTVNFWCKEGNTTSRSVYFGGYNTGNFNIEMFGGKFRVYWSGNPDRSGISSVENNIWTMWTVVVDKATGFKTYKNGELVDTYSKVSGAMPTITPTGNFRIGWDYRGSNSDGTVFEGAMSDFRIYATTLSDNDIIDLYKVPVSIAENGTIFNKEIKEAE